MALYTYKSKQDALAPLANYSGDDTWVRNQLSTFGYGPSVAETQVYNAIGRQTGQTANSGDNFITKKLKSAENALGTTGAVIATGVHNMESNEHTKKVDREQKDERDALFQKYGFESRDDYYKQLENSWDADGNATAETERLLNIPGLDEAEKALNSKQMNEKNERAKELRDWAENNYASKKVSQDRGKFLGSAMNTLSTGADVLTMAAGVPTGAIANAGQGAWEGIADELEQNGLENFDWGRAGQNAAIGAASGAVTGAVNKGLNNAMTKRGGNLLKGGNALTRGINAFNQNTGVGRTLSTIGSGAARGAISGAVGGATGAGLSSALNGVELGEGISNTLQGATQGAAQGAIAGGAMAGANLAANAALNKFTPGLAERIQENQMRNASYGDTLRDQFKGAYTSGDSVVAENVLKPTVQGFKNVGEGLEILANRNGNNPMKNVGMRIEDVATETPEETANTMVEQPTEARTVPADTNSQWDNLAVEAGYKNYDEVIQKFMEANPGADVNAGAVLTWLDNNPGDFGAASTAVDVAEETTKPLTGKQIKAKREIVKDITDQFEAVDQPTARATKPNETFYNLYEEWGLSDGDDIRQAVSYAEPGSLIPEMIREAAGEAGVVDLSDAQGLIMDLKINKKNYNKYVNALEDIMDSTDTTIIGGKRGVDALELQRTLEKMASDARGTNGTYHIGNTVVDETMARNFQRIANNIGDKLDEAAVSKGVVQNVLNRHAGDIQQMRNAFPDNAQWQDAVDTKVSSANTIRDLRHSIKDLTRANIFISNGDERYSTFGGRYAARANAIPTTKAGAVNRVVNDVYDKVAGSRAARNMRLSKNAKIVNGETATPTRGTMMKTAASATPDIAQVASTTNTYKPSTQIYNAVGRVQGEIEGEKAAQNYLDVAAEDMGTVAINNSNTDPSTSLYNTVTGGNMATNTGSLMATMSSDDYYTNLLERALNLAMEADDAQAFGTLYGMYQDALAQQQKNTTSTEVKLTDKQRQANAAERALNDFEGMENNFGFDVSDIPVLGQVANFGGNEYKSKAEALALQIGYMLSGATVNKDEAKKIGESYVPQPRDSEAVRRSKLNQLRGIISDYQKTYEG